MLLILGGTGILGSRLVVDLLRKGYHLRLLYRSEKKRQKLLNFLIQKGQEAQISNLEWIKGDIRSKHILLNALHNIDAVFHCANMVSFDERERYEMLQINHLGTQNVVDACLLNNVKKLIFVSSIATLDPYEDNQNIDESNPWNLASEHSSYAQSKYLAELEVWRGKEEGLDVIVVKPGIILTDYDFHNSSGKIFKAYKRAISFYTHGQTALIDTSDVSKRMIYLFENEKYNESFILIAQNISFYTLSNILRKAFHKSKSRYLSNNYLKIFSKFYQIFSSFLPFLPRYNSSFWKTLIAEFQYDNSKINELYDEPYRNIEKQLQLYATEYLENE